MNDFSATKKDNLRANLRASDLIERIQFVNTHFHII